MRLGKAIRWIRGAVKIGWPTERCKMNRKRTGFARMPVETNTKPKSILLGGTLQPQSKVYVCRNPITYGKPKTRSTNTANNGWHFANKSLYATEHEPSQDLNRMASLNLSRHLQTTRTQSNITPVRTGVNCRAACKNTDC